MIDRAALAAAFDATADKLADVAYNQMMKSEEANAMFDRAQQYRRAAEWLDNAGYGGPESPPPCLRVLESLVGRS